MEMENLLITVHDEKSLSYTIHDSLWIPCSAKFISVGCKSNLNGVIDIFEIENAQIVARYQKTHEKALKCGTLGASKLPNRHLSTGDFSGNLNIWDLEDMTKPIYSAQAHSRIISSIDGIGGNTTGYGAPEIVTGSEDGFVKVWDPRQKDKPVVVMEAEDGVKRECWAVAFGNSYNSQERVVCAGYDNGDVKLFDLKAMSVRWEKNFKNGVCSLEFDRKCIKMNKLLITSLEGTVVLCKTNNALEFTEITEKKAHNSATVWCGKHSPFYREIFATTGGSGTIGIWKYSYNSEESGELNLLQNDVVSSTAVNSFDWCPDKSDLAVCSSFDQTIRLLSFIGLNLQ